LPVISRFRNASDAPRTHSGKMRNGTGQPDCAEGKVKE
jgi:hypothetical protein